MVTIMQHECETNNRSMQSILGKHAANSGDSATIVTTWNTGHELKSYTVNTRVSHVTIGIVSMC
eukprot:8067250-Lingulodinium_polyedra.AAC.1